MTDSAIFLEADAPASGPVPAPPHGPTFTTADVERIVRDRLAQQAKNKFGELEARLAAAEADALRFRIAAEYGVSAARSIDGEPSDVDLFLTGTDEATLTAQAQRFIERRAESNARSN